MDSLSQYIGKHIVTNAVNNWNDSSVQQLYKKNSDSFVWRIRDNDQEKNNFVYLIIRHQDHVVSEVEIEALSISAMGQVKKLCNHLTENELTEVRGILAACIDG